MPYNDLRAGRFSATGQVYHITTNTRNREPVFADLTKGRIVVRHLMALEREGTASTLCYVVMPDHLHWLLSLERGELSDTVRILKGRISRTVGRPVWQPNFHDHAVRREEDLRAIARYIVANPVRAGLVARVGEYALWDAVWLGEVSG